MVTPARESDHPDCDVRWRTLAGAHYPALYTLHDTTQRRCRRENSMLSRTLGHFCASLAAATILVGSASSQPGAARGEWHSYGADAAATKYSALAQIDASNVGRLRITWRRPALDAVVLAQAPSMRAGRSFRSTPLMIDGVLYAPNGVGFVEAFDPGTGRTLWVEPPLAADASGYRGASTRGIGYWTDGRCRFEGRSDTAASAPRPGACARTKMPSPDKPGLETNR
jgi:hypothetical protein